MVPANINSYGRVLYTWLFLKKQKILSSLSSCHNLKINQTIGIFLFILFEKYCKLTFIRDDFILPLTGNWLTMTNFREQDVHYLEINILYTKDI